MSVLSSLLARQWLRWDLKSSLSNANARAKEGVGLPPCPTTRVALCLGLKRALWGQGRAWVSVVGREQEGRLMSGRMEGGSPWSRALPLLLCQGGRVGKGLMRPPQGHPGSPTWFLSCLGASPGGEPSSKLAGSLRAPEGTLPEGLTRLAAQQSAP